MPYFHNVIIINTQMAYRQITQKQNTLRLKGTMIILMFCRLRLGKGYQYTMFIDSLWFGLWGKDYVWTKTI